MIDRRTFLAGTGALLLATPLAVEAQQAAQILPRIGFLAIADPKGVAEPVEAFRQGLPSWAGSRARRSPSSTAGRTARPSVCPALAVELVRVKSDIIIVTGTIGVEAARQATSHIPIVIAALLVEA